MIYIPYSPFLFHYQIFLCVQRNWFDSFVSFQLPEEQYWKCDKIVRYRVTHQAVRRPEYVRERVIEIADVNMYENYTVSVSLINDANRQGPRTSVTYVGSESLNFSNNN